MEAKLFNIFALLLFLLTVSLFDVAVCQCTNGWTLQGTRCYLWQSTPIFQRAAVAKCAQLSARLPVFKSNEDMTNYEAFQAKSPAYAVSTQWIGLIIASGTEWVTIDDGSPLAYNNWEINEPNGGGAHGCAEKMLNTKWNDVSWNYRNSPFSCEQSASGQTEVPCAKLNLFFYNPAYFATPFMIMDTIPTGVTGSDVSSTYNYTNLFAATIHVPSKTQPLYQVTFNGSQIMATDAELPSLSGILINRVLAYFPLQGASNLVPMYLMWPTSINPVGGILAPYKISGLTLKSTLYAFVGLPCAPTTSATCSFTTATTTCTTTTAAASTSASKTTSITTLPTTVSATASATKASTVKSTPVASLATAPVASSASAATSAASSATASSAAAVTATATSAISTKAPIVSTSSQDASSFPSAETSKLTVPSSATASATATALETITTVASTTATATVTTNKPISTIAAFPSIPQVSISSLPLWTVMSSSASSTKTATTAFPETSATATGTVSNTASTIVSPVTSATESIASPTVSKTTAYTSKDTEATSATTPVVTSLGTITSAVTIAAITVALTNAPTITNLVASTPASPSAASAAYSTGVSTIELSTISATASQSDSSPTGLSNITPTSITMSATPSAIASNSPTMETLSSSIVPAAASITSPIDSSATSTTEAATKSSSNAAAEISTTKILASSSTSLFINQETSLTSLKTLVLKSNSVSVVIPTNQATASPANTASTAFSPQGSASGAASASTFAAQTSFLTMNATAPKAATSANSFATSSTDKSTATSMPDTTRNQNATILSTILMNNLFSTSSYPETKKLSISASHSSSYTPTPIASSNVTMTTSTANDTPSIQMSADNSTTRIMPAIEISASSTMIKMPESSKPFATSAAIPAIANSALAMSGNQSTSTVFENAIMTTATSSNTNMNSNSTSGLTLFTTDNTNPIKTPTASASLFTATPLPTPSVISPTQKPTSTGKPSLTSPTSPPATAQLSPEAAAALLTSMGIDPASLSDGIAIATAISAAIPFLLSNMSDADKSKLFVTINDTINYCEFEGRPCDMKNEWKTEINSQYGNCFTFIANEPPANIISSQSEKGLHLILQGSQEDNTCNSPTTGYVLQIHEQTELSLPDTYGRYVPPGYVTNFAFTKISASRLRPPYGTCIGGPKDVPQYYYNGTYVAELCWRSCFQKFVLATCNCSDPRYAKPDNAVVCGIDKKVCVDGIGQCENAILDTSNCGCAAGCTIDVYLSATSASELVQNARTSESGYLNAAVHVNFAQSYTVLYTEKPAYDMVLFLYNISNFPSMFTGFCIMSIFEVLGLLIRLVAIKSE